MFYYFGILVPNDFIVKTASPPDRSVTVGQDDSLYSFLGNSDKLFVWLYRGDVRLGQVRHLLEQQMLHTHQVVDTEYHRVDDQVEEITDVRKHRTEFQASFLRVLFLEGKEKPQMITRIIIIMTITISMAENI